MTGSAGKVHVVRVSKTGYVDKQGRAADYSSAYLRRTYRDGGKVKNETLANLSALPAEVVAAIEATLEGRPAGAGRGGGDDHRLGAARARRRSARDGRPSWACPRCSARPARSGTWRWPWSSPGWWPRRPSWPP